MDKKLIYIADDEVNVCTIMKSFLVKEGYVVETFYDGRSIYEAFSGKPADMVIIDIMMPGLDGYSVCSAIREQSSVPLIIVSAKDSEQDKVTGLTIGCDDYLTKPFSPRELIARVKSIFRRIEIDKSNVVKNNVLNINDIIIDQGTKQAKYNNIDIGLTLMEFNLLYYLASNKNRAISRSELLNKIWGFENVVETRATDDMIKRIRRKISDSGSGLKIETVWGFGFKIMELDSML